MKKLYVTLALSSFVFAAGAQSQRLVLVEEFTQASCGPCAAANPAFNTLLTANTSKVVSLKYQVSWPGVDPMNAQYTNVSGRASYYSVTGVPYTVMDGVAATGASYTGYPGNLTQSEINSEYNTPAPFTLDVQHYLSSDLDSVFITAHATATQSYNSTGSYLRLHTALIEKHIHFSSPPGSNGEMDFYNVVRKMVPNTAGTGLAANWSAGQDTTFTFGVPVPSYIYDVNQLAVVCFIEDNVNKQVQQAAFSISPLGIATPATSPAAIQLYPNPAGTTAMMNFNLASSSDVTINLYNEVGMLVRTETRSMLRAGKQETNIDVAMLANGLYMVELIAGETRSSTRLNVVH